MIERSKLCLGTVQFGMKYGINNKLGKPCKSDVFEMMEIALENGIEVFDTANAYGDAEELLGEYLSSNKIAKDIKVISKLKPNVLDERVGSASQIVLDEVERSLEKLKIEKLDGYLLHTPGYFYNESIIEGLKIAKEKGLVDNIGVSIYEMNDALAVASSKEMDYIQIPYSVFDQRVENTSFFDMAKSNKVKVFARSAFLQGLLTMEPNEVPDKLGHAKKHLKAYDEILSEYGVSRVEAAMHFVYANSRVDYLVFGVDHKEQLLEDIKISKSNNLSLDCVAKIKEVLKDIDESIIFPSLWKKKD